MDELISQNLIKTDFGPYPKAEQLKGKKYCKFHNMWNHNTSNCIKMKDQIQIWLNNGRIQVEGEKTAALVDSDPFPPVGMVEVVPTTVSQRMQQVKPKFEAYSFDAAKAHEILDELISAGFVRGSFGVFPSRERTREREFCKFHNCWTHSTVACVRLKDQIQDWINE